MLQPPNQVLVIDDDEAAREILVELLGRIGFHAFAVADGKAGLEWLARAAAPPQDGALHPRLPGVGGVQVLGPRRKPCCSTCACPCWMDSRSCAATAPTAAPLPSSRSRQWTRRRRWSRGWGWAPATTW